VSTPVIILALDPGKDKCGIAVVSFDGEAVEVVARRILPADEVEPLLPLLLRECCVEKIILGDATTSRAWHARLSTLLAASSSPVEIAMVNERGSTLEARSLYWKANPPRGWRRVLPLSLQNPPEPVDDFAAIVLAQRFFGLEN
jgi:RNase H-fold protein (predicted Holliday junction resolvase)